MTTTTSITLSISGSLYDELRHGTALDDGTADTATWGYGASREVDVEVYRMVEAATGRKVGFGHAFTMTGSADAWRAIREYAADRSYMEQNLAGDFDGGLGRRLGQQAEKITKALDGERQT